MAATAREYLTPEEYLALERRAETKHEYFDGVMVPRAGCDPRECQIAANAGAALGTQLRDRPFLVLDSNLRIGIEQLQAFTYPDLSVVHDRYRMANGTDDVLVNPFLIVEVFSPSTERYDRTGKFLRYQRISSFAEYLLIAQDEPRVELCSRQADGAWEWASAEGLEATIAIPALGCTIALADIYNNVCFDAA